MLGDHDDYKTAKEAFVADNPGSSITTILSVSLVAWTSYALYAFAAPRFRPSFKLDYLTSALPLLLSVTTFADSPYTLNLIILLLSLFAHITSSTSTSGGSGSGSSSNRRRSGRGSNVGSGRPKKSAGSWLDESDSDEEPSEPPSAPTSARNTPIKLPSQQVAFTSATAGVSPLSPSSNSSTPTSSLNSPSTLSVDDPFNNASSGGTEPGFEAGAAKMGKRRISPQPSPEAHMVDILPTPSSPDTSTLSVPSSSYPSRSARTSNPNDRQTSTMSGSFADGIPGEKKRLPFLSIYRAHMMLLTAICILAVDFPVFPRWFGKCEDFGTSLMDVGVGSFVFSLGLISVKSLSSSSPSNSPSSIRCHQRRSRNRNRSQIPSTSSRNPTLLVSEVLQALRKSAPTLALGMIRVIMVKGVEYPEHVTEYGVHWNFFFTIGLLPVFGVLIRPLRGWTHWSLLGVMISLAQQLVLSHLGLQDFLLSSARPGLIGANKEGLASLPGYISIYLLGLATGEHVLRLTEPPPTYSPSESISISQGGVRALDSGLGRSGEAHHAQAQKSEHYKKRRTELVLELFGYSVAWWSALVGWRWLGGEVSRRFANTPYVLFIAGYNTLFLLGYLLLETYLPSQHATPPLLEAINKNGLVVFLVANLGTGLVNMCVRTMYVGNTVAVGILGIYTVGVCGVAWALRGRRIKL
ncbi:hypothetical protein IAU59_007429 [Kwoniella sp. CBS 9459]